MCIAGCGHSSDAESERPRASASQTVRPEQGPVEAESPAEAARLPIENEIIEGRILDTSPLGHGDCTQRSYQVEPSGGGTAALWLHWERCGSADGPSYGNLDLGRSYRFTVERGASENFGGGPMIVSVEPL